MSRPLQNLTPLPPAAGATPLSFACYWATRPVWPPGWVLPPERRRHAVLWLLVDGELTVHLPDQSRAVGPGWLVAAPPDLLRSAANEGDRPVELYSLGFDVRLWGEVDFFRFHTVPAFRHVTDLERLAAPWRELLSEVTAQGGAVSLIAEGWARVLVGRWLADLEAAGELRRGEQVDERVRTVLAALEGDLAGDWSLHRLAELVHLSPVRLRQVFVAALGVPPMRYLLRRRIALAASLLSATDLPAAEIAARCGFHDPSYFGRAFQRVMGIPPSVHRQRSHPPVG